MNGNTPDTVKTVAQYNHILINFTLLLAIMDIILKISLFTNFKNNF